MTITHVDYNTAVNIVKMGDELSLQCDDWDELCITKEIYLNYKKQLEELENKK